MRIGRTIRGLSGGDRAPTDSAAVINKEGIMQRIIGALVFACAVGALLLYSHQ
jgi:hypothetical protein